jgi:hypothetical protein
MTKLAEPPVVYVPLVPASESKEIEGILSVHSDR